MSHVCDICDPLVVGDLHQLVVVFECVESIADPKPASLLLAQKLGRVVDQQIVRFASGSTDPFDVVRRCRRAACATSK